MSMRLVNSVWKNAEILDLTLTESAVLSVLAGFASDDGSNVYPSVSTLSKMARCCKRTVHRTLRSLRLKNLLKKVKEYSYQDYKSSHYKINAELIYSVEEAMDTKSQPCDTKSQPCDTKSPNTLLNHYIIINETKKGCGETICDSEPVLVANAPSVFEEEVFVEEVKEDIQKAKVASVSPKRSRADMKQLEEQFTQWYTLYPRKEARKKACDAFKKVIQGFPLEKLLELTAAYAKSVEDKEKQFIPYPATWLNGDRWNDVETVSSPQSSASLIQQPPKAIYYSSGHIEYLSENNREEFENSKPHYRTLNEREGSLSREVVRSLGDVTNKLTRGCREPSEDVRLQAYEVIAQAGLDEINQSSCEPATKRVWSNLFNALGEQKFKTYWRRWNLFSNETTGKSVMEVDAFSLDYLLKRDEAVLTKLGITLRLPSPPPALRGQSATKTSKVA